MRRISILLSSESWSRREADTILRLFGKRHLETLAQSEVDRKEARTTQGVARPGNCGRIKSRSAVRQTLKESLSAPFTSAARRPFPKSTCERLPGKARTRFGESQSHAGDLRLRNTPLLSSARRSQRTYLISLNNGATDYGYHQGLLRRPSLRHQSSSRRPHRSLRSHLSLSRPQ